MLYILYPLCIICSLFNLYSQLIAPNKQLFFDFSVGKSAILHRFCKNVTDFVGDSTVGRFTSVLPILYDSLKRIYYSDDKICVILKIAITQKISKVLNVIQKWF